MGSKILETARIATSGASYALIKRDFNIPSLRPSEQPSAHSNMDPDGCWGKNRVSERALFCETRDRSKTASSDTSTLFRSLLPNMNFVPGGRVYSREYIGSLVAPALSYIIIPTRT